MANWPVTLPQSVLQEGFGETLPDTSVRTAMDAGPPKVRRRTTAAVRPISAAIVVDATQASTLETFYLDTLKGGALPFDMVDPRTGVTASFMFAAPPAYVPLSGTHWRVSLSMERQP